MRLLLSLLVLVVLSSCGPKPMYEKTVETGGTWTYGDPMVFDIEVTDTDTFYDMVLDLNHESDFGYQNIYVKIDTDFPVKEDTEDVVSLDISDGKGSFLGNCSGGTCRVEILLQKSFRFENPGKHIVTISQYGRTEDLNGVNNATLSIIPLVKN